MTNSMIYFGMGFVLLGFSAIILKKYPIRNLSFRNLQRKYANVDEKKAMKLDGIFCITFGAIYIILSILEIKNSTIFSLSIVFITAFLCIIYHPIRRKYLNLK